MGYGRGYKLTKIGTEPVPEDFDTSSLLFSRDQYDLISVDFMNVYKETYSGRPRKKLGETKRHIYTAREHVAIPVIKVRCKRCGQIHQAQDHERIKCFFGPCSPAWVDITNQRFGNLVAIKYVYGAYGIHGKIKWYWMCRCDCGDICYKDEHALVTHSPNHHVTTMCPKCANDIGRKKVTLPDNQAQWNAAFSKAVKGAADRGYAFELSYDEYKELCLQPCYYCGAEPAFHGNSKIARNGVDRFDNTIGYIHGNCLPCCSLCNMLKRDISYNEWIEHLERIVKHCNERSTTISKESTPKQVETDSPEKEDIV